MDATISVWPFITWQLELYSNLHLFQMPDRTHWKVGRLVFVYDKYTSTSISKNSLSKVQRSSCCCHFLLLTKKGKRKLIGCYSLQNVFLCLENVGLFQITWHISDFQNHTAVSAAVQGAVHSTHLKKVVLYVEPTLAARLHTLCAFVTFHTEYPSKNPALLILYFHSHWQTHT